MHNTRGLSFGKVLLVLITVALLAFAGLQFYDYYEFRPMGDKKEEVKFSIADGQPMTSVLDELEKDGLIRSADATRWLVRLSGNGGHYAGTYMLNKGMSTREILEYISNPDNVNNTDFTLTVTPGTWAKDVAASINQLYPQYPVDEIINTWNNPDYINQLAETYPFIDANYLNNTDLRVKLEGYLFPDTYNLEKDMSIDQITHMMLDQLNAIYQNHKEAFDNSQYSFEEILTMASIVQFEAGNDADMKDIAGVFYNRLNQNMDLQSSVTVCYALDEAFTNATACETNTDVDSPYNTYLYPGLPIGPIDNPGEAAILAALEPAQNNYLFFVADINNTVDGKIHYSETYEDHEALIDQLGLRY